MSTVIEKLRSTTLPPRRAIPALATTLLGLTLLVGAAWSPERHGTVLAELSTTNAASPPIAVGTSDAESSAPSLRESSGPFERLPEITFFERNGTAQVRCRLYSANGAIDELAAQNLENFLADTRDPKQPRVGHIDRRLLQLLFRTAYHFEASRIDVTSAYREQRRKRRREGLHALGRAIDFAIPGVKTEDLASYLRKQPRVGVGIYSHRRTRFVHLDVREQSYHWLDASPPGRTWRGVSIGDRSLVARDAAYEQKNDWPEGLPAPISALRRGDPG